MTECLYTVITEEGYWGKGETPEAAANEANLRNNYVNGVICYADPLVVKGEIQCTDMGGIEWMLTDKAVEMCEKWPELGDVIRKRIVVFRGRLRRIGGRLEVQGEIKIDGFQV